MVILSQNKITDFLTILAWDCSFTLLPYFKRLGADMCSVGGLSIFARVPVHPRKYTSISCSSSSKSLLMSHPVHIMNTNHT